MNKNDNYETPQYLADWAINYAISIIGAPIGGKHKGDGLCLLEPGCGANAPFAMAGRRNGCKVLAIEDRDVDFSGILHYYKPHFSTRLVKCVDFLDPEVMKNESTNNFDIIATNPPFSKAEEFIWRSLELLDHWGVMIFLLKLPFLASQKRRKLFSDRPPQEVWVFQRRPSFSYDGHTDMTEYGFYVWFGKSRVEFIQKYGGNNTVLKWLDNKEVERKHTQEKTGTLIEKPHDPS